jgi:hypothetical protein
MDVMAFLVAMEHRVNFASLFQKGGYPRAMMEAKRAV